MPNAILLKKSAVNEKFATALQSKVPVRDVPGLREAVNFDESRSVPVHRWFKYREGFSPTILDKLNKNRRVFDPFCGCGTTLIEAKKRGIDAVGTDVNPLAVFVAKVKTRNYSVRHVREFEVWAKRSSQSRRKWPVPKMPLLPKLFRPQALDELLRLRAGLERCSDAAQRLAVALLVEHPRTLLECFQGRQWAQIQE